MIDQATTGVIRTLIPQWRKTIEQAHAWEDEAVGFGRYGYLRHTWHFLREAQAIILHLVIALDSAITIIQQLQQEVDK